ncbi:MAG TPA: UDP-glucose 4-epimerase GalE [Mycobacteriales bacterium]|nr:UDP-glucose 4-epimerase GalE [Mycobacteriales bacterium]
MAWLVTGGAGYIGAHVVAALLERGEGVVVLDDLSTGDRTRVGAAPLVEGSILDRDLVRRTLRDHDVHGIVHIAAKKQVGESVADPLTYYEQNVTGTIELLRAAVDAELSAFLFSSSAATYGTPPTELVTEDSPTVPMSPYGTSKLVGEWAARDVATATGLRVMALRYFNVAGAASPELGDPGVFNLIPLAFQALSSGEPPRIFGADYPTADGTCIRDYVHVSDIADAHVAAARQLAAGRLANGDEVPAYRVFNIGRGQGVSVREVLEVVRDVTGIDVEPVVVDRRPGDPAAYAAVVDRINRELGWSSRYDLRDMVESAWAGWQHRAG